MVDVGTDPDLRVAESLHNLSTLLLRRPGSGLSLTASGTLSHLARSGPLRITELAARTHVSQPSMTELVSRLERAGLAERARDPEDGRVVLVELTANGRALREQIRRMRARQLAELLVQLDAGDRAALTAALPALDRLHDLGERALELEEMEEKKRG